ncbi:hypothetical protein CJ030_MR4G010914 [Morella rubra]|uniref:non-specific serine/threonine protein kinase n=1 Tax=Morella rubra TaxID=262757 RepID=A0A6A1VS68_9ROSI|nr:hypothetical protein CJ030_MR4G010900 [Morella rubra]KAB1215812.1 hypothetical protein CJ030_MR4G010914 [Morella rubra]
MQIFSVSENQLRGTLPWDLGITLPNLQGFGITMNQFIGSIPVSISNASYLSSLYLERNMLTGTVPSLEKLHRLEALGIEENLLGNGGGDDLSFLCSLTNATYLRKLAIDHNNLGGLLPDFISNFSTTLSFLRLNYNKRTGDIPTGLTNLINLEVLLADNNELSGTIPFGLGNLGKLVYLDFSDNNFTGSIPSSLGNLGLVVQVYLGGNKLHGKIPHTLAKCQNLLFLNLSRNNLSGIVPSEVIGLSSSFVGVDFEIPASIGSCVRLEYLSLGRNFFHGHIPSSLESLRGIQSLVLSHNNLSGEIPKFLERFTFLELLDLSFNHFEGEVPVHGVFNNTNATRIEGNNKLCGGVSEFQLPKCEIKKSKEKTTKLTLILKLVIPLLFARLGGTRTVAVKVLNLLHHGASKSFIAECQALRNIRHLNLVKVLTACSSVDYQGHDFKALVYEFMVNGNLNEWLHSTLRANEVFQEQRNLSLLQRLNIAIDVASALEYLHHQCETPIVHCDLKPSNVLLDDEMNARVGDFGLARFLLEHTQDCSTNQSRSIGVRGTMGYAAPEYGLGNEVSTYGDVYSYGILLLEMFTGKKLTNHMFKNGFTLHDFVRVGLQEQLVYIVDPILLSKGGGETIRVQFFMWTITVRKEVPKSVNA